MYGRRAMGNADRSTIGDDKESEQRDESGNARHVVSSVAG